MVEVLEGYTHFPRGDFDKYVETFYPLAVELLGREMGLELRLALQSLFRRIGECRMHMPPPARRPPSLVTGGMPRVSDSSAASTATAATTPSASGPTSPSYMTAGLGPTSPY